MKLLAVVRVRGQVKVRKDIEDTMKILKLYRKNYCVLIPGNTTSLGMLTKVKDYVTFGEIEESTLADLLKHRGRLAGNKALTEEYLKKHVKLELSALAKELLTEKKKIKEVVGLKPFFRLSPPKGGFERKGIKQPFSIGGVLGYRKGNINELLRKML